MGFFKDVKQGVGLTVGYKVAEGGISVGKKAFRAVAGVAIVLGTFGAIRTCATEPEVARDAILNKDGSALLGKTLDNTWDNAVLVFKEGRYLFNKVAGDGKGDTYEMRRVKPSDCPERIRRLDREGYDSGNPDHQFTVERC